MPCALEVELHPVALVLRVDEAEGVRTEAVHVPVAGRDAALAHDDGDLVQHLGQQGPEIPNCGPRGPAKRIPPTEKGSSEPRKRLRTAIPLHRPVNPATSPLTSWPARKEIRADRASGFA